MHFLVYGAGAIGGTLGGLLADAGHEVSLIARGRHLAAIQADGLAVVTAAGRQIHQLPAFQSPAKVDWSRIDVVLLAMKSQDTEPALRELAEYANPVTPVVCVQNGVANEARALRLFPHVYGVCVMFPATHLEPGVVQADCAPVPALLDIGRYPTGVDETASAISAAFRSAGCHSDARPDIMAWKYAKLLLNLDNSLDLIFDGAEETGELREVARQEGVEALRAAAIRYVSAAEDLRRRDNLLQVQAIGGKERAGSSSRQSLLRGTGSVEADYLNGEISLLGRLHEVPTPVNDLLTRLANIIAREGREPGSFTVAEFRTLLG